MTEELKAIVEVIGNLGEEGIRVFLWYLVLQLADQVLEVAGWMGALWILSRAAFKIIASLTGLDELAEAMPNHRNSYVNQSWHACIRQAIASKFWVSK